MRPDLDRLTPVERDRLAQDFLRSRAEVWQKRLKLQDWKISVVLAKRTELRPDTLGNIRWDGATGTATIRVLSQSEYGQPYDTAIQDMENTLVHEMVHLELAAMPRTDASRAAEERAVNGVVEALLQLDRGGPR